MLISPISNQNREKKPNRVNPNPNETLTLTRDEKGEETERTRVRSSYLGSARSVSTAGHRVDTAREVNLSRRVGRSVAA